MAVGRVALRVIQGGHNIPELVVRRRYLAGIKNFWELYRPLVDQWEYFDNSGQDPILLDRGYHE